MNDNKQTTKTLDDILAEMRNAAKDSYAEKTAKRLEDHEATGTRDALDINDAIQCLRDDDKYLLDLADRIKAAVDRMRDAYCDLCKEKDEAYDRLLLERDKALKASASGNVAAIRRALERIDEHLHKDDYDGHLFFNLFDYDPKEEIRTALDEPARNCDRFNDEQDAQLEFLNEVWLISVDKESMLESDKFENWTDEMRKRYARWLLEPAKPKTGKLEEVKEDAKK